MAWLQCVRKPLREPSKLLDKPAPRLFVIKIFRQMTAKEKINEVINTLENTAKACEISTVAEIKNNLKSAISNLQAVEAETASGDNLLRQRIEALITETESQKYYPTPMAAFVFALKDVLYSTPVTPTSDGRLHEAFACQLDAIGATAQEETKTA